MPSSSPYGSIFVSGSGRQPFAVDDNPFFERINLEISRIRDRAKDGWTWQEITKQLDDFAKLAVDLYRSATDLTGEEKKAWVMDHAIALIDEAVMPNLPIPAWLSFVLSIVGGKAIIRNVLISVVDGMVESAYDLFTKRNLPEPEVQ